MKKDPPGVLFRVFKLSKYENTNEHVLVKACKIHESVLYQALFFLFLELSKNEEGHEFSFLDSLKLYKKEGKGSSFKCLLYHGSKSCLLEKCNTPVLTPLH